MKNIWIYISVTFVLIAGVSGFLCYKILNSNDTDQEEKQIEEAPEILVQKEENSDNFTDENKTSKGYTIENINGVTYIDGILIVNKTYSIPEDFVPTDTFVPINDQEYCQSCINKEAYEAFKTMKADAQALGLNIYIQSGYRSYKLQQKLYNNYIESDGKEAADTYSARPGYSEHQTGLSFDLNSVTDAFANTPEGKWVQEYAYKYGFIIRYPKAKENITNYKYESWHLRYVGKDLAAKLYNKGDWISLEEYFGIDSQYAN